MSPTTRERSEMASAVVAEGGRQGGVGQESLQAGGSGSIMGLVRASHVLRQKAKALRKSREGPAEELTSPTF